MKQIGVLSFQGSVEEHIQMLQKLPVHPFRVHSLETLLKADGLIIPGGESTTFLKILHFSGLYTPLQEKIKQGLPTMATCAGLILLASQIESLSQETMDLLPIRVCRNGYGPQIASFCEDISVKGLGTPFHAVFIRAPIITTCGAVDILASDSFGHPVLVQKEKILGLTFHPELTEDSRLHDFFVHFIDKI